MALNLYVPDSNPTTGSTGAQVRPITEGVEMTAVQNQTSRGGLFGVLDQIGETIGNAVGQAAQIKADQFVGGITNGPEQTVDSTGDPADQAGGSRPNVDQAFFEKYKRELMIGGAVVGGLGVLYLVTRG